MRGKKSLISSLVLGSLRTKIGMLLREPRERTQIGDETTGNLRQCRFCGDARSKIWPGNRITVGSHIRISRAEKAQ